MDFIKYDGYIGKRLKRLVAYFLIMVMIVFQLPKNVLADEIITPENKYIYDNNGNTLFVTQVKEDASIYFYGRHNNATTGVTYHTVGFNIALKESHNKNITEDGTNYRYLARTEDGDMGSYLFPEDPNYTQDTYKLKGDDVVSAIKSLLRDEGFSNREILTQLAAGVPVYFSNVFEIIYRATQQRIEGSGTYKTLEKMRSSVDVLGVGPWSSATYDILESYYDNVLVVKLPNYSYDVKFVDATDFEVNKTDATVLATITNAGVAEYGGDVEYELADKDNIKLLVGGKVCKYTYNSSQYYYSNGMKNGTNIPYYSSGAINTVHLHRFGGILYVLVDPIDAPPPVVSPAPEEMGTTTSTAVNYFDAKASGVIDAESKGAERFSVTQGVPTTENLYCFTQGSQYLINVKFNVKTGNKVYPIKVKKTYNVTLSPDDVIGATPSPTPTPGASLTPSVTPEPIVDEVEVEKIVNISREYQYTEIASIDYYKIDNATITNAALPGGSVIMTPTSYSVPTIAYTHYEGEEGHLIPPEEVELGIVLDAEDVDMEAPDEDFTAEVDEMIGELKVKNDKMTFGGSTVLDDTEVEKTAPEAILSSIREPAKVNDTMMYENGLRINDTLSNSTYPTSGVLKYTRVIGFNSVRSETLNFDIKELKSVKIHTPVVCDGTLLNDNNQYVQLVNPDLSCIPLVLDENGISSDFTVSISNFGTHNSYLGYYTRNYVMNTLNNTSYIAKDANGVLRNEVKFPFDVMIDVGNDKNMINDTLLVKDTWYAVGTITTQRFYLPMYVETGTYTVDFRTVAINGTSRITSTQEGANLSSSSYVATDSVKVQVSGKVYGLTLYDINDMTQWKGIFRPNASSSLKIWNSSLTDGTLLSQSYNKNNQYYYTVGTNNELGDTMGRNAKFTFPLVFGSHPSQKNQGVLKAGYTWRFTLDTVGDVTMDQQSKVVITPRFYYVDKNGTNREEVDLYYSEKINGSNKKLVKIGNSVDATNLKTAKTGDVALGIPESELKKTASINSVKYTTWIAQRETMYGYFGITTNNAFKTFTNTEYAKALLKSSAKSALQSAGYTEDILTKYKQSYYFNYSLPSNVKAVSTGTDVSKYAKEHSITYKENFWKQDGYLIINFNITTYDKNGNVYTSYINGTNYMDNGQCCMWLLEGAQKSKTDYYGTVFNFKAGDTIMIFTDSSSENDYTSGGIQ